MNIQPSAVRQFVDNWFSGTLEASPVEEGVRKFDYKARAAVTVPASIVAIVEAALRLIGAVVIAPAAAGAALLCKSETAKSFVSFYQRQFIEALGDALSIPLFSLVWRQTQFAPEYTVREIGDDVPATIATKASVDQRLVPVAPMAV